MSDGQTCAPIGRLKRRLARLLIVLAGIVLGQIILYGPSLAGRKILLPLDILADPIVYLPRRVEEIPTRIVVSVRMETPGLVVLADLWDNGWQAYLKGRRVPILRTNHAIRGVVVPAGSGTIEFRYAPASFARGIRLASCL